MANSQEEAPSQHPDLLAAVVLHTLVSEGGEGMTVLDLTIACKRNAEDRADIEEIERALRILLDDGLAQHAQTENRDDDDFYRPTRAAIRAAELSF